MDLPRLTVSHNSHKPFSHRINLDPQLSQCFNLSGDNLLNELDHQNMTTLPNCPHRLANGGGGFSFAIAGKNVDQTFFFHK